MTNKIEFFNNNLLHEIVKKNRTRLELQHVYIDGYGK